MGRTMGAMDRIERESRESASTEQGGTLGQPRTPVVFITGAGGEVGHGLIKAMGKSGGDDIVATDLRELDQSIRDACTGTSQVDVCDREAMDRLLSMYRVTDIFHLAAVLSTRAEFAPEVAHQVNVNGTVNILQLAAEQARMHGEPVKVIFPSSIAVYGFKSPAEKARAGAVGEAEFTAPRTMYGCNKLYCENLGRYYARNYRQLATDGVAGLVDFRCIRYPGLISADTVPTGGTSDFVPEMLHAAARGQPYRCFVRPDTRIPFMTMPEAVHVTLQLAAADPVCLTRAVYNIASFNPSAAEVAELVLQYFPDADISYAPDPRRQAMVDSWPEAVDTTAARDDWGFKPHWTLQQAFDAYLVPGIRATYGREQA